MNNIEVEIKSYLEKKDFDRLLAFFNQHGNKIKEDYQETYYLEAPNDLRIQNTDSYSKLIMKSGDYHDEIREEVEIKLPKDEFHKLKKIMFSAGHKTKIKWVRRRHEYTWKDCIISLDDNIGTGYFLEIEKPCTEETKDSALAELKEIAKFLDVEITPLSVLVERFDWYKKNWRSVVEE